MGISLLENHIHDDVEFPVIFHTDVVRKFDTDFPVHWHENIEILYFLEGDGQVVLDSQQFEATKGDIIVINSNQLHGIYAASDTCRYRCLIVDSSFAASHDIFVTSCFIETCIKDESVGELFESITFEMQNTLALYKSAVKANVILLLTQLFRNHRQNDKNVVFGNNNQKVLLVKGAIDYIRMHLNNHISIDEMCSYVGFSKYYFCRVFKELTGKTVVDYTNYLRCTNARRLLSSGQYNVSEAAGLSGFNNLSYFSKIYKKHMGIAPHLSGL